MPILIFSLVFSCYFYSKLGGTALPPVVNHICLDRRRTNGRYPAKPINLEFNWLTETFFQSLGMTERFSLVKNVKICLVEF